MPDWIADPTSVPFWKAADFWFGAIGFVITIIGFRVGLKRLRAVEAASSAATAAVLAFKFKVRAYDAAKDAAEAQYALQSALRHLDGPAWLHVQTSLDDATSAMKRVSPQLQQPPPRMSARLKQFHSDIDKIIISIDQGIRDPERLPDIADVGRLIRSYREYVSEIQQIMDQSL